VGIDPLLEGVGGKNNKDEFDESGGKITGNFYPGIPEIALYTGI
jgi:hypothetical protein